MKFDIAGEEEEGNVDEHHLDKHLNGECRRFAKTDVTTEVHEDLCAIRRGIPHIHKAFLFLQRGTDTPSESPRPQSFPEAVISPTKF